MPTFSAITPSWQSVGKQSGLERQVFLPVRDRFVRYGQPAALAIDSERLQQAVWYWRRVNAGQLKITEQNAATGRQYPFDGPTIALADRVFVAIYGRTPAARDWTSTYLLILRNLKQDPDFYQGVLARMRQSQSAIPLRMSFGRVQLQRAVRASGNRSSIAAMMAGMVFLFVGGQIGIAIYASQESDFTRMIFAELLLVLGVIGVAYTANATDVSYRCPECGREYRVAGIDHCEQCHLEFGQPAYSGHARFVLQTS